MIVKRTAGVSAAMLLFGALSTTAALATPGTCGSAYDFFFTSCPLTWYGVTVYGTVDMGGTYQTHGAPFDPNFPTGSSQLLGAGGPGAVNRTPGFGLAPNGESQSNVGMKIKEPIGPNGWSFISQFELAFDPYSGLLSNAPQALQNSIGTPQNQQGAPYDSSRWGWLGATNVVGLSQPVFGTVTFGRQNSLNNDSLSRFDPQGSAYAFSLIEYSGKMAGGGGTEEARWTTAIKYRENVGDFHFAVMGQPIAGSNSGYNSFNPNNGAVAGEIGWDIKHLFPGVLSLNFLSAYERDAVNITGKYFPGAGVFDGFATAPFTPGALKATISDNTSFTAEVKYSFGSWGNPTPFVSKAPPTPSGIPLTLYAGYEYIQLAEPSDKNTSLFDDGFPFAGGSATTGTGRAVGPGSTTTINNNAFDSHCGTGGGCTDDIFQYAWTGAKYGITRNLDIIGAYYIEWQNQYNGNVGSPCKFSTAHSSCAGNMDVWSLVLDWRFLPKWDWYIGTMYSVAYGGIASGDIFGATNNLTGTSGVRFRF